MPTFNKTQLYIDKATDRGIVHRDYLAHCLRWSHVLRHAKVGQNILDIGCGINTPLAMTFYTNKYKPNLYMGMDLRYGIDRIDFNFPAEYREGFDVTLDSHWESLPQVQWDIAVSFEVLEHMPKEQGIMMLENISAYLPKSAIIFLSTPCFNGSAAANHIHEWGYEELKDELEKNFKIEAHYGTFASQSEIIPVMSSEEKLLFLKLKEYYDSNVLAILMAPLHPNRSRNCIWRLRVK